jgi:type VI secretion system protein VasD
MEHTLRGARWFVVTLVAAALVACASSPLPPPLTILQVDINVLPNVNPDARGRPSPVVLRLYELKTLAAFTTADFFALLDKDKETLGAELVAREEYQLVPGEQKRVERKVQADTRYIGVTVAFRDLERAQWRATMPVAAQRTTAVEIKLDASKVTLAGK